MNFDGINALVLGGGVSGAAAARLLISKGARVTLADGNDTAALRAALERAQADGARLWLGKKELPTEAFDLCVASPAFALDHGWIKFCGCRNIPVISELELGARCWKGGIIAVTGSKGKSSVVKLCADTLNLAGKSASPAGNYGIPLSSLALEKPELEWAVTEVSSFQMEHTAYLPSDVAILLNVQPDHLDRHGNLERYRELKLKMFKIMREGAPAFLPESLAVDGAIAERLELLRFGVNADANWRWQAGCLRGVQAGGAVEIDLRGGWFDNEIFGVSAAAAAGVLHAVGVSATQIERGFKQFVPLEHRMEHCYRSCRGVDFINDSKATSISAVMAALKMVKTPVRLIAGGLLKEDLSENIKELLAYKSKKVYLIGHCSQEMFDAWSEVVQCVQCGAIEEAVKASVSESQAGETVLLSPGTASFDQFNSYCERGKRFKELVRTVAD
ncbi:MAG: UDP-N-acetylmuramoyl-L-alanine--D-glutamate ligase [Kiritimatiellae bacterium]|nr:UDP-N-acetylmuramoyl-L-alanine--D-glutamate ligase [Kiritimatiellia bacterium]